MSSIKKRPTAAPAVVPALLPPVAGLDEHDEYAPHRRPRTWLWTLLGAIIVVFIICYLIVLAVMAIVNGLQDRTVLNRQAAQEHYALGLSHMAAGEYELAGAEFRLAIRYDSSLRDARTQLRDAEQKALTQVSPTSETRLDAVTTLYKQAVTEFEGARLAETIADLEELRGLDATYERDHVQTMLVASYYQLGLNAVSKENSAEAQKNFQAVLALEPGNSSAQNQLDLLRLYTAALSNWGKDWAATVQAFKGLYSLAPGYRDVRIRLHDAHSARAEEYGAAGDWCAASEEYAAAVSVLVLEDTVDQRDDAAFKCQATAEAPHPTPTAKPRPTATAGADQATPDATGAITGTATPVAAATGLGQGRIAFASYSAVQKRLDVYVLDLAKGGAARLLQENACQPAFAPAGKRLAFRNLNSSHLGLGILGIADSELGDLTAHQEDSTPAWSPDAKQIAFASNKHGDRKWRVYALSPGEVRGEGEQWAYGLMPTWSPDGTRLAYQGCDERGDNCAIWTMKAGGFEPTRLTKDPSDTAPSWSPDGAKIAYISARTGNWELFLIDVASGQEKRLTDNRAADVAPTWSPDGKQIAFLSNREGGWAIYVLDVASGRIQKVIATGDAYPDAASERLSWTK